MSVMDPKSRIYPESILVKNKGTFSPIKVVNSAGTAIFTIDTSGNTTVAGTLTSSGAEAITGATTITAASATALVVGPNGTTGPTVQIDSSTASAADGLKVKGAAAGSGVALSTITTGTNAPLTIDAAGSGTITIAGTSTGAVTITPATTITGALTQTGALAINGGATVATAKTLVVTDADALTVGGIKIGTSIVVPLCFNFATPVDTDGFLADRAYQVTAIKEIHSVTAAGATLNVRKITDTAAPGAAAGATVKELLTGAFAIDSTINTAVTGTLTATTADLQLATGNRLALDFIGTTTNYRGNVYLYLKAI